MAGRRVVSAEPDALRVSRVTGVAVLGSGAIVRMEAFQAMSHLERKPSLEDRFIYLAEVERVVDGDTVVLSIDLGCGTWLRGEHCRLRGIDAPETRGGTEEDKLRGWKASAHLEWMLEDVDPLIIRTHKDEKGKFGRWLVELFDQDGNSINARMITDGFAERFGK